jgi:flavorubredoxin
MTEPRLLFSDGVHECYIFNNLVEGQGVQANQFLIVDGRDYALIDPGGDLTYNPLALEVSKKFELQQLKYVFASHQDPDIISSLDRWLLHTNCQIITSRLWSRFLPHLASGFVNKSLQGHVFDRIVAVPDEGMKIPFGNSYIACLPAHFLHSVGNIQFYDPVSKILFSGDMGASMGNDNKDLEVKNFIEHIPKMIGFHRRYMCSRKISALWASMIRRLDVDIIVPQHGPMFKGKENINLFLDWISQLECGIDLMSEQNYQLPF